MLCKYSLTITFSSNINDKNTSVTNDVTTSQITQFYDASEEWATTRQSVLDPTFNQARATDTSLEHFFRRPIKINEFEWEIATDYTDFFNPWTLYMENPRVVNRLCNFNLLRANMCLKIVVNGNAFYYGRLMMAYRPLPAYDEVTRATFDWQDNVNLSQFPRLFVDPTTSQGGLMRLPYVYRNDYLSIPLGDWNDLGEIHVRTLGLLHHANGGTDSISVSVFAWLENVVLAAPTATPPLHLVPQSGDEYSTSPISTPAAAISSAAAALTKMPYIGNYAMATQQIAQLTATVAKMFGFSRPSVVEDIIPIKPSFGNYANTAAADASYKLTFDPKQEVTVDPSVVGLEPEDEMSLKFFTSRESFLTYFIWPTAGVPEQVLWSSHVTPSLYALNVDNIHMTPMCFAAVPFKYWRGSIRFRFQIVCSGYHKGRLKVVYDPFKNTTNEYNTNYTRIVDISKERDFTIEVGWGSPEHFLRTHGFPEPLSELFGPWTITTPDTIHTNGVIGVYIVNDLTTPNTTVVNDIRINVFVSAGPDFELVDPVSDLMETFTFLGTAIPGLAAPVAGSGAVISPTKPLALEPQSGTEVADQVGAPHQDTPLSTIATQIVDPGSTYKVFFGDPVASIRQLLKRFSYHSVIPSFDTGASGYLLKAELPDFPYYRGYVVGGIYSNYNPAKMTIQNWFTPCYVCRRGGMRWKHTLVGSRYTGANGRENTVAVSRAPLSNTYQVIGTLFAETSNTERTMLQGERYYSLWSGGVIQPTHNAQIEVELPYHTNKRFYHGRTLNMHLDASETTFHRLQMPVYVDNNTVVALSSVAAADDFSLSFLVGTPIVRRLGHPI